jgi:hypothetical protein
MVSLPFAASFAASHPYLETVFDELKKQPVQTQLLGRDKLTAAEYAPTRHRVLRRCARVALRGCGQNNCATSTRLPPSRTPTNRDTAESRSAPTHFTGARDTASGLLAITLKYAHARRSFRPRAS